MCSPSRAVRLGAARKVFDDVGTDQEDSHPTLDAMPPDVLEAIAKYAGADLPAFACVSKSIASVMHGAMWRSAYEAASPAFDVEGWGWRRHGCKSMEGMLGTAREVRRRVRRGFTPSCAKGLPWRRTIGSAIPV